MRRKKLSSLFPGLYLLSTRRNVYYISEHKKLGGKEIELRLLRIEGVRRGCQSIDSEVGGVDQRLVSWGGRNFTSPHQELLRPPLGGMYIISPNSRNWVARRRKGGVGTMLLGLGGERGNL